MNLATPTAAALPKLTTAFKVVNVLSRQVLADNVGVAETLQALRSVRSVVDVNVYVWEPNEEDWRPLTMSERRTLWGFRNVG